MNNWERLGKVDMVEFPDYYECERDGKIERVHLSQLSELEKELFRVVLWQQIRNAQDGLRKLGGPQVTDRIQ